MGLRIIDIVSVLGIGFAAFFYRSIFKQNIGLYFLIVATSITWFFWFPSLGWTTNWRPFPVGLPFQVIDSFEWFYERSALSNKLRILFLMVLFFIYRKDFFQKRILLVLVPFLMALWNRHISYAESVLWILMFSIFFQRIYFDLKIVEKFLKFITLTSFFVAFLQFYKVFIFPSYTSIFIGSDFYNVARGSGLLFNSSMLGIFLGLTPLLWFFTNNFKTFFSWMLLTVFGVVFSHSRVGFLLFLGIFVLCIFLDRRNFISKLTFLVLSLVLLVIPAIRFTSEDIKNFDQKNFFQRVSIVLDYKILRLNPINGSTSGYSDKSVSARVEENQTLSVQFENLPLKEKIFGSPTSIIVSDSSFFSALFKIGLFGLGCLVFYLVILMKDVNLSKIIFVAIFLASGIVMKFWEYNVFLIYLGFFYRICLEKVNSSKTL